MKGIRNNKKGNGRVINNKNRNKGKAALLCTDIPPQFGIWTQHWSGRASPFEVSKRQKRFFLHFVANSCHAKLETDLCKKALHVNALSSKSKAPCQGASVWSVLEERLLYFPQNLWVNENNLRGYFQIGQCNKIWLANSQFLSSKLRILELWSSFMTINVNQ